MRIRNLPRNRESRPRRGAPTGRPSQEEINQSKLTNLPSWRRKLIRVAKIAEKETQRRYEFYLQKGWVTSKEAT